MDQGTIKTLGMRLANRTYIYRMMHIVFGAVPTAAELDLMGDEDFRKAFTYLADVTGSQEMRDAAQAVAEVGAKKDAPGFLDAVHTEYQRLYMVPGPDYVYPWASSYEGGENVIFRESTLDVRKRYAEWGFEAEQKGHFPEDHVAMMMDFLANLSQAAYDSFADGDDAKTRDILQSQASFALNHLGKWLDEFAERTSKHDRTGVYDAFAKALVAFVGIDEDFIGGTLNGALAK